MTPGGEDVGPAAAVVFGAADAAHNLRLDELRADPRIEFIDHSRAQLAQLARLLPTPGPALTSEPTRWVYYPWRRAVIHLLGPHGFRRLRLDRTRNLITTAELDRLGRLRIGVVGLSAGHVIAHTLAAQGLCGGLRLADFDQLELPNLNRVLASVCDLGVNKAVVAARRIAELDPYLPVTVEPSGVTAESLDGFIDGLDIVIEECDSLEAKVLIRHAARAQRLPVLMATSDRGLLDVERFDIDPSRPILHGLLDGVDTGRLADLTTAEKVPYVLRMMDAAELSPRMAASLVEVAETLSTWPQLASEVALGATTVAEAVRRIGLQETLPSGRVRIDIAAMLDNLQEPAVSSPEHAADTARTGPAQPVERPSDVPEIVAAAVIRAPSGGNGQPWHVEIRRDGVTIRLAPEHTTMMDVGYRGSAVALGAAVFNARVAAAAHGSTGRVEFEAGDQRSPLTATVLLAQGGDPDLAPLYDAMLQRETNRRRGERHPIDTDLVDLLDSAARVEGARLRILNDPRHVGEIAEIFAAADRIRYLTPHLHTEMFAELRWPGDPASDCGIEVQSLELAPADLASLGVLRRSEVMANLAAWDGGSALGDDTYERVTASAAIGVITIGGDSIIDYARAGSAVESVWIKAQQYGLGVQPISPPFLYAHDENDLRTLSPGFSEDLGVLQYNFRKLTGTPPGEVQALVLRFCRAPRASVRSRRRALHPDDNDGDTGG